MKLVVLVVLLTVVELVVVDGDVVGAIEMVVERVLELRVVGATEVVVERVLELVMIGVTEAAVERVLELAVVDGFVVDLAVVLGKLDLADVEVVCDDELGRCVKLEGLALVVLTIVTVVALDVLDLIVLLAVEELDGALELVEVVDEELGEIDVLV